MSLFDAARHIQKAGPPEYGDACLCCQSVLADGHAPDCPWLRMPQIVAALEAVRELEEVGPPMHSDSSPYPFCCVYCLARDEGSMYETRLEHYGGCPWQALVAALKGAEVAPSK